MAQKQRQSLIFATQPLRPTLFVLLFKNLKQMLQRVLTAVVDRTLTAHSHNAVWCCLINSVLEMSASCIYTYC